MKKAGIFLILLAFLCVGQGFGPKIVRGPIPVVVATGLPEPVAYWKMEAADHTTQEDATANNHDLSESGDVNYSASGKIDGCANFDGLNTASILYSTDSAFGGTTSFTISFWCKVTGAQNFRALLSRYSTAINDGAWGMSFDDTVANRKLRFTFHATDGNWSPNVFPTTYDNLLNVWTFVCFGYNASSSKGFFYTNTVLCVETAALTGGITNFSTSTAPFTVGNYYGSPPSLTAIALFDEMAYWDRVLTADEMDILYNDGDGITYPF